MNGSRYPSGLQVMKLQTTEIKKKLYAVIWTQACQKLNKQCHSDAGWQIEKALRHSINDICIRIALQVNFDEAWFG